MPRIIINADDLGYSPGINRAIEDLCQAGLITSASLLVNQPFSQAGASIARTNPHLSLGVHLNLSKGRPLLPPDRVPSLVDETGRFWHSASFYRRALLGQVNWFEAAAELEAQVDWAIAQGLQIDNLDSHVHFHTLPPARRLTEKLAAPFNVAASRHPDRLAPVFPGTRWNEMRPRPPTLDDRRSGGPVGALLTDVLDLGGLVITPAKRGKLAAPRYLLTLYHWGPRLLDDQALARLLARPGVVTELVVHPGVSDDLPLPLPDQLRPAYRQQETDLLTAPRFRVWLERLALRPVGFGELRSLDQ